MADEKELNALVVHAVEETYERHGLIYHWESAKQDTPHYEGLTEVKVGNLVFYLPLAHKLGVMVHNQFREILPGREFPLIPLREGIVEWVEKVEAEAKEKQRLKEIADKHRKAAMQEQEAVLLEAREQKEAPKPSDSGAPTKGA